MKCQRIQRWLSDSLDEAISGKKKALIEEHIATCSACRTFREQIERINEEAMSLEAPERSSEQSREFAARLRSALVEMGEKNNEGVFHAFRNKWVFIPASVIMISLFILIFVFYEKRDFLEEESYIFSFGNAVEEIYREIGDEPAVQEAFHALVSASLNEMLSSTDWEAKEEWEDNFFLWEELSEEELRILEREIKNENNS
jgi:hypothetical protein